MPWPPPPHSTLVQGLDMVRRRPRERRPCGWKHGLLHGGPLRQPEEQPGGIVRRMGDAEALKNHNIKTWELGGFTYKQDPLKYYKTPSGHVHESSSDPLGIVTAFKAASTHRPMTNALVLKNDEAGIDGVGIMCSNRPLDIPEAELKIVKDVTTNMCGEGKTVCSRENVTTVGTGIVADGAVVQSAMVIEQGLAGKCAIRELREEECQEFGGRVKNRSAPSRLEQAERVLCRGQQCPFQFGRTRKSYRRKTLPGPKRKRWTKVPTAFSARRPASVNCLLRPSKPTRT